MSSELILGLAAVGLVVGIISAMMGIGGGVLVIPALTLLFGFSQERAVGTSLGMLLPPIGLFAFLSYYSKGNADLWAAGVLAAAFTVGALLGSIPINKGMIPGDVLRRLFAFFMIYVSGRMLYQETKVRAVLSALVMVLVAVAAYAGARLLARRCDRKLSLLNAYRQNLTRPTSRDYEI